MSDPVNHPAHYQFPGGAQPVDIAEHLTFNTGSAIKYLARAGRVDGQVKGDVLQDLHKAAWYINREIERLEKENNQ